MSAFVSKPFIISIEGNIGTGKSTFLENLESNINKSNPDVGNSILFLKEPVDIWESIKDESGHTILEKFYKDQRRYAFTFQVMAYISRLSMLKRAIKENPQCKVIIIERSLIADKNIFMQMLYDDGQVEKMEFEIYNRWYNEFIDEYRVDAIIYLDSDPDVCAARINRRNRNGEDGIPLAYLEKCRDYHSRWLVDTRTETVLTSNTVSTHNIKHEKFNYSVLQINTNSNTEYSGDANCVGKIWLEYVKQFIYIKMLEHVI
jgi:deoxyadenosine/deoxycytidine kinase